MNTREVSALLDTMQGFYPNDTYGWREERIRKAMLIAWGDIFANVPADRAMRALADYVSRGHGKLPTPGDLLGILVDELFPELSLEEATYEFNRATRRAADDQTPELVRIMLRHSPGRVALDSNKEPFRSDIIAACYRAALPQYRAWATQRVRTWPWDAQTGTTSALRESTGPRALPQA